MKTVGGRNGRKTDVKGDRKERVSPYLFAKCAEECGGDIRKMSQKEHLNQPAQSILGRYKTLLKKNPSGIVMGVKLPQYKFELKKKRIDRTPELWDRVRNLWNNSEGDAELVAKNIGCSSATIINWVNQVDDECWEQNIKFLMEKYDCDHEKAENLLVEKGTFVSLTCDKKKAKKATEIDPAIVSGLDNLIASELGAIDFEAKEKDGAEKLLEATIETMAQEAEASA